MPCQRTIVVVWASLTSFWMLANAAATTSCASRVAVGDQDVGISAVEDSECKIGGLGCFSDGTCRFCQKWASAQSNHLSKCTSGILSTQAPSSTSVRTPTPTTPSPVATAAPTVKSTAAVTDCAAIVKRSNMSGISFVIDKTCNVSRPMATGCTALTSCRLCRTTKNEDNQFLVNCAVLQNALVRRMSLDETADISEGPKPKHFNDTLFLCVGGMALVVAIMGLAHSKICRRDTRDVNVAVDDTGLASESKANEDVSME